MQSIPNWSVDTSIGQPVVASELATSIAGAAASQLNLLRDLDPKKKSLEKQTGPAKIDRFSPLLMIMVCSRHL